jgi:cation transport protein ChaC
MLLSRTDLESKRLQQLVVQSGLRLHVLSEAQLQQSIQETLRQRSQLSDIWIFAYGSLIWNPIIKYRELRVGTIYGWHRCFCLWTPVGRGTPDNPGLLLGLERGASCHGVAYRLALEDAAEELLLLWRREMVAGSYIPRWVKVFDGEEAIEAIAFTINYNSPMYAGKLSSEVIVNSIATAKGLLGTSADYLVQTVNGLMTVGIKDKQLLLLHEQVVARQQALLLTRPQ